jgi:E3 ubiquitin-protein ligase EL5
MAVTATTVAAATTMLSAVAAVFLTFVLCFYIFVCAKRYRGGAPAGRGAAAWARFLLTGGGTGAAPAATSSGAAWCYEGGLDKKSMAKLPCREVGKGESLDCAVCIAEVGAGEAARVLPRCGHAFHVACVDMWLSSHSTCPLCRRPAVDDPPAAPRPEADPESPIFPTNVLFFGSQDEVRTGRAAQQRSPSSDTTTTPSSRSQEEDEAARVLGLRRLLGCGGASPPPAADRDIETGLVGR